MRHSVKMITIFMMIVTTSLAQQKPITIKSSIKKADRVVAKSFIPKDYWNNNPTQQATQAYMNVVGMIEAAGIFDRLVKVSVPIMQVIPQEDGSLVIDSVFVGRKITTSVSTASEVQALNEHDKQRKAQRRADRLNNAHTNQRQQHINDEIDRKKREREFHNQRTHRADAYRMGGYEQQLRREKIREQQQFDRRLEDQKSARKNSITQRAALTKGVYNAAAPRLEFLQNVYITLIIPPDLVATIKLPEVMKAKRILFTGKVSGFSIRAPIPEIKQPPAIGELEVIAIDISRKYKRKP